MEFTDALLSAIIVPCKQNTKGGRPMINLGLKRKEMLFQDTESELLSEFYSKSTDKSNREFRFARVDSNFINF